MSKKSHHGGLGVGLGLAAIAAAAAGAYFFYGKQGAKNRKHLKSWTVKARGEVMEKLVKMSDVSQDTYEKTVNEVLKKYKSLKQATPKEIGELSRELKSHWKSIKSELDKASKKVVKNVKKATR